MRFFRKDGHSWRKKSDGKTVRETHEKLKARIISFLLLYARTPFPAAKTLLLFRKVSPAARMVSSACTQIVLEGEVEELI